jgi:predicted nuclease of predicted toxin-antitoxin system
VKKTASTPFTCGTAVSSALSKVLELAFAEDRILATANVGDFARLASSREMHAGIVLLVDGDLLRDEQLDVLREAVRRIEAEVETGLDMINRVLRISIDGTATFEG